MHLICQQTHAVVFDYWFPFWTVGLSLLKIDQMSDGILFSGVYFGGPVSPLLKVYCIFHYSIHFETWRVTHPSANRGPSCLTSEILRELVFQTWYCRSILFYSTQTTLFFFWECQAAIVHDVSTQTDIVTQQSLYRGRWGWKPTRGQTEGKRYTLTLTLKHSFRESPREIDGTSNVDWVSPKDRQIFKHEMVKHKL